MRIALHRGQLQRAARGGAVGLWLHHPFADLLGLVRDGHRWCPQRRRLDTLQLPRPLPLIAVRLVVGRNVDTTSGSHRHLPDRGGKSQRLLVQDLLPGLHRLGRRRQSEPVGAATVAAVAKPIAAAALSAAAPVWRATAVALTVGASATHRAAAQQPAAARPSKRSAAACRTAAAGAAASCHREQR